MVLKIVLPRHVTGTRPISRHVFTDNRSFKSQTGLYRRRRRKDGGDGALGWFSELIRLNNGRADAKSENKINNR